MKKLLAVFATLGLLWSAAPVYAQDKCTTVADLTVQVATQKDDGMDIKFIVMKEAVLFNFMAFFESLVGPAPVEYDEGFLVYNEVLFKLILLKDGCQVIGTRESPVSMILPFMQEAGLD